MKITLNLKNNFKLVEEGERVLKITKAEATPSGKPDKLKVTFQDVAEELVLIMINHYSLWENYLKSR